MDSGISDNSEFGTTWNLRFATRTVPDTGDGNYTIFSQYPVNNPVRRQNNLADIFILLLRHDAADLRELCQ